MHRSLPSLLLLVAFGFGLWACERDTPATPNPGRLTLVSASGKRPEETGPRVVRRWEVGEELPGDWSTKGGTLSPAGANRASSGNHPLLVFKDRCSVKIRGPHDPQSFNQLAVSLELFRDRDTFDVKVLGVSEGRKVFQEVRTVQRNRGATTLLLDLGHMIRETRPLETLKVTLTRVTYAGLRSIEFVHKPVAAWLPPPEAPRPILVGDEARPGFGLSSREPLTTRLSGRPGQRLSLGYGRPEFVSRPEERVRLVITLSAAGQTLARESIDLAEVGVEGWSDLTIPLEGASGQALELRCELEHPDEHEAFCALTSPELWEPVASPQTVVLVTSDTHRADHVGRASNGAGVQTPFLDELADRGVFFEDCSASTNVTNPSHATLFTGLPPRDTGVTTNMTALSSEASTLAEAFRSHGFLTVAVTSVGHLRHDQSGFAQGFERFLAPERRHVSAELTLARLVDWLPDAEGRPLFVWLHVFDAHGPYRPPAEYSARYWQEGRDPYDPDLPALPEAQRTNWDPDLRDLEFNLARYKGEVTYVDDCLREAFAHPRLANAFIVVTADHGEAFGEHGFWFNHENLYPATTMVPLIIAWPSAPGGTRIAEPVRQLDVGRTLLNLVGLRETPFPGKDLFGDDGSSPLRYGLSNGGLSASLREGRWFLSLYLRSLAMPGVGVMIERHQAELFDLDTDPGCMNDVIGEHPDVARRMRTGLVRWLQGGGRELLAEASDEIETERLKDLAALGYAMDMGTVETELFDPECDCTYCEKYAR